MAEDVHFENAARDGQQYRGWLVGHFINRDHHNLRRADDVEVKWVLHPAAQQRDSWASDETATTLCMLTRGQSRLHLSTGIYTLTNEGDYLMWDPGVDHFWHAEEDSLVLTIRWLSRPTSKFSFSLGLRTRSQPPIKTQGRLDSAEQRLARLTWLIILTREPSWR